MADQAPSPFRRPGFLAAAGFLAIIVVLGVVVAVASSGGDSAGDSAVPATAPPGASSAPGGSCHPTDTTQQVPTTAPPGVRWELFQAIALPTSATAGPLVQHGEQRSCYAHTPVGAMIAALQISARLTYSSQWRVILDQQVVDGPGKTALARERASTGARPPLPAGEVAQVAGFRFITYSADTAVISLLLRLAPSTYAESTLTVKWQDGDWRLELQPDGSPDIAGPQRSSLEGYVAWGGV